MPDGTFSKSVGPFPHIDLLRLHGGVVASTILASGPGWGGPFCAELLQVSATIRNMHSWVNIQSVPLTKCSAEDLDLIPAQWLPTAPQKIRVK